LTNVLFFIFGSGAIYKAADPEVEYKCPSGDIFASSGSSAKVHAKAKAKCWACWDRQAECSGPEEIAKALTERFEASCIIHDMCYMYEGRNKYDCDSDFLFNMGKQCGADASCHIVANIAYTVVRKHSGAAEGYRKGQERARTCTLT